MNCLLCWPQCSPNWLQCGQSFTVIWWGWTLSACCQESSHSGSRILWCCKFCVTCLPPLFISNEYPPLFLLGYFNPRSSFTSVFSLTWICSFLIKAPISSRPPFPVSIACLVNQWYTLSSQSTPLSPAFPRCLTLSQPSICAKSSPLHHYCSPDKLVLPSCICAFWM